MRDQCIACVNAICCHLICATSNLIALTYEISINDRNHDTILNQQRTRSRWFFFLLFFFPNFNGFETYIFWFERFVQFEFLSIECSCPNTNFYYLNIGRNHRWISMEIGIRRSFYYCIGLYKLFVRLMDCTLSVYCKIHPLLFLSLLYALSSWNERNQEIRQRLCVIK